METYNERKNRLWDSIHLYQDVIKTIQEQGLDSPLAHKVISMYRDEIQKAYQELKEVTRWFKTTGLDPNEPFNRRKYGRN